MLGPEKGGRLEQSNSPEANLEPFQVGSLWVTWMHEVFLEGRSFWAVKIPQDSSWGWRNLVKLRTKARKFLSYVVGDGKSIFLWLDNWHPDGILYQVYGPRIVYDAATSTYPTKKKNDIDAKLHGILIDKEQIWKPARTDDVVKIQSKLHLINLKKKKTRQP